MKMTDVELKEIADKVRLKLVEQKKLALEDLAYAMFTQYEDYPKSAFSDDECTLLELMNYKFAEETSLEEQKKWWDSLERIRKEKWYAPIIKWEIKNKN